MRALKLCCTDGSWLFPRCVADRERNHLSMGSVPHSIFLRTRDPLVMLVILSGTSRLTAGHYPSLLSLYSTAMQYIVDSEQFDSSWNFLIRVLSQIGVSLLLYGIYVNLFLLSIYTLARRREIPAIKFLMAASCVMAVVGTTQMAVTFAETVVTVRFVQQLVHAQVLNRPHFVKTLSTVENVLLATNMFVTDSFFMYRCYVIWGHKRKILIPPVLLILVTLVVTILGAPTSSLENATIPVGLAAATNLVLTALTAGRIMYIRRESSQIGLDNGSYSRYNRALGLILESGAIYCVGGILLFITASLNDLEIFDIGFGIAQQMLNIIPTFTLVHVGLNDNPAESNRKASPV
ncbi:hypothetical protein MVEN_02349400 [Mycena venus]|uniref:Uncharacterized protein n=1 Tax=Mycena venus TaxID=2733690 RepID=A0A8H7CEB4_9AGAR|nr:hypothetical protein MVEN_02349400 [Mycena venus]